MQKATHILPQSYCIKIYYLYSAFCFMILNKSLLQLLRKVPLKWYQKHSAPRRSSMMFPSDQVKRLHLVAERVTAADKHESSMGH